MTIQCSASQSRRQMRRLVFLTSISALATCNIFGAEIILPSRALERDAPVHVLYRTGSRITGKGELTVKWTDAYGRLVEDRKIPVELTDESDVGFELDLRRAVAMRNDLSAHFSLEGVNKKGEKDHRDEDAQVSFVARPPDRTWWDYQIIMWQDHSAEHYALLKTLGVSAGMYTGRTTVPPEALLKNDLHWYGENIATDFYSEYHRWSPDRPVNWKFLEAKALYKKDPSSKEAFKRHPSLSDPEWIKKIHDRIVESVRFHSPYRPLFYNLADESGIADNAAYWDFDFSDQSLAEMRSWLKKQYGTLAALNQQWGSSFNNWDAVTPMTTKEAMQRSDENFSSWGDFKEWMDISFARALKVGVDAAHSVDPEARVAIEGGQIPGWGGYDYSRLAKILDAIEPYDMGSNIDIVRSFNPKMVIVTTSPGGGPWEKNRVWHELLHGNRGLILWDDKSEYVTKDGTVGGRGSDAKSYYNEIRNGIGALLINSESQPASIAIHYSQPSMRTEWMLEQKPKGEAWANRGASSDYETSPFRWLRESYCRLLEDLGYQFSFVASDQIEGGGLLRGGYQVLILPHSTSLSETEAKAMREFVEQGGVLIADGNPGAFDEHSRRLPKPYLADLFGSPHAEPSTVRIASIGHGKAIYLNVDLVNYYRDRLLGNEKNPRNQMGHLLKDLVAPPAFKVISPSGEPVVGVETEVFRNGGVNILAIQTNPQLSVEDIGPPEVISNRRFEKVLTIAVTLPSESYVYDVRAAKTLGKKKQLTVQLDPYEPSVFAISPIEIPQLMVSMPARLRRGETGEMGLSFSSPLPASVHVFHVELVDPSGKVVTQYSGNILAPDGRASKLLPLAFNDNPGRWEIRTKDLLSGQTKVSPLEVY